MASASLQPTISVICSSFSYSSSSSLNTTTSMVTLTKSPVNDRRIPRNLRCQAMVQQAVHGAPAAYAKEMERLSAKESLLLAFQDAGGFEALVTGKTTDMQQIDVNERITSLERLNPSPRPTTSPFLEGQWNFEWLGSGSPGLVAAKFVFQIFPSTLANLSKMDVVIKDAKSKVTANFKLLNSIESRFTLSANLTVEGPLRMKEEYVEGVLESPTVIEETIPEQLKGAFSQAVTTMQQLPVPIRDVVASGLRVPLTYQPLSSCLTIAVLIRTSFLHYIESCYEFLPVVSFVSSIMAWIDCPEYPFTLRWTFPKTVYDFLS